MQKHKLFFVVALSFISLLITPQGYSQTSETPKIQLAGLRQLFRDEEPYQQREYYPRSNRERMKQRRVERVRSYYREEYSERNYRNHSYIDDENTESNFQEPTIQEFRPKRYYHPKTPKIRYSEILCDSGEYDCIIVKRKQTWSTLFPDPDQRDIVRRLNRTNMPLTTGKRIAVPKNLDQISLLDVAPFDRSIDTHDKKLIIVDLKKLAWAAYDVSGNMLNWGPVSGGRGDCTDTPEPCLTIEGVFSIFDKRDKFCISKSFPVDQGGGAPMPYCMFFSDGFALHGSSEVPGYNASHGCVRMYKDDAEWLNHEFIDMPQGETDKGTEVIVRT